MIVKKTTFSLPLHPAPETPAAIPQETTGILVAALIGVCMLCIALLSFFVLSKQSLRLDEAQSLWQSSHTPHTILSIIAADVHVPLYGLMLHFWEQFFGDSVARARLLSLIFLLLTVPMSYFLAKRSYNKSIALFTALIITFSPFLNWYGSEIRMYSMLTFITVMNQYFFIRIFKHGVENNDDTGSLWIWYGLTALVGIYTHYFFWTALATQAVFYFIYAKRFPKHTFRNFVIVLTVLVLAIAPWVWYVKSLGWANGTQPHLSKPTSIDLFNILSQFLFGFQDDHINTLLVSLWPLSVLLAFLALNKNKRIPPESVYFFLAGLLPITMAFVISVFVRPLFLSRYLILAAPSLYIFIAWFISLYAKRLQVALRGVLAMVILFTLFNQSANADTPVKEDYYDASAYISQHISAEDIIAISAPFTVYPFEYYYTGPATMATLPIWDRSKGMPAFVEQQLPAQINQLAEGHQKIWLLMSYDQGYESTIHQYFESHYERVDERKFSKGIHLYVYRVKYNTLTLDSLTQK